MAVQMIGFSDELRKYLADLHLAQETGQITPEAYEQMRTAAIEAERTALQIDSAWRTDNSPSEPHYPGGKTSVFWKPIPPRTLLTKLVYAVMGK